MLAPGKISFEIRTRLSDGSGIVALVRTATGGFWSGVAKMRHHQGRSGIAPRSQETGPMPGADDGVDRTVAVTTAADFNDKYARRT
jgi:hypothetical protein